MFVMYSQLWRSQVLNAILTDPFNLYQTWPGDNFVEALLSFGEATQRRRQAWDHVAGHLACVCFNVQCALFCASSVGWRGVESASETRAIEC